MEITIKRYVVFDRELGELGITSTGTICFKSQTLADTDKNWRVYHFNTEELAHKAAAERHKKNYEVRIAWCKYQATCKFCQNYSEPTNIKGCCSVHPEMAVDQLTPACTEFNCIQK